MKRKSLLLLLMILPIMLTSTMTYAMGDRFSTHLTDENTSVMTLAQGQALFTLSEDGQTMTYRVIVANIKNVTMAHIHVAAVPGGNGAPVVWIYPASPPAPMLIPGRSQGTLAMGSFTADDFVNHFAGMDMEDLLHAIHEGRAYLNVHTTANPGGEIRGYLHMR